MQNLPTYKDCSEATKNNSATPLQSFIEENEPAGDQDKSWRSELLDAVNYVELKAVKSFIEWHGSVTVHENMNAEQMFEAYQNHLNMVL